ncbi:MAG: dihydrolipoyl dehydrogenase family protein [Acidimicrobiales bacterium]
MIIIGAGSTGTNAAGYLLHQGLSCVIVEGELVGGSCSYWACIPSKALLAAPAALAGARRLPGSAAAATGSLDAAAVFGRRDELVKHRDDSSQADWLASAGATLLRGHARLRGVKQVQVDRADGSTVGLTAERAVVIATGSTPMVPPVDGLAEARSWTNREATEAEHAPDRLAIIGGGVVGCELGQAFARLGSHVTIVERADRILAAYPPWVSEIVAAAFADDGIEVRCAVGVDRVKRHDESGPITLHVGDAEIEADEVLVATGRRPATDDIGLDHVDLGDSAGDYLTVDALLRVAGAPDNLGGSGWLYAVGDVNGRALLTHQGKYEARCVADTIAGRPTPAIADEGVVPQAVFTDPPVASVGVNSATADRDLHEIVTVRADSVAAASLAADGRGGAEMVIDREKNTVVGATFACHSADELLHAATIAIVCGITVDDLWHCVPAFPTMSELWLRLLEAHRGI